MSIEDEEGQEEVRSCMVRIEGSHALVAHLSDTLEGMSYVLTLHRCKIEEAN
jgi:hypothetical protein